VGLILPDHVPFEPGPLPTELPEGRFEIDDGADGPYAARPSPAAAVASWAADKLAEVVDVGPVPWLLVGAAATAVLPVLRRAYVEGWAGVLWRAWCEGAAPWHPPY
jgi:hypothetical protein